MVRAPVQHGFDGPRLTLRGGRFPKGYANIEARGLWGCTDDDSIGERVRQENPPVRVPCQVDTKTFEELRMFASGNAPRSRIDLVLHFKDLERMGLVDAATGDALIRPGDRLGALYDTAGAPVQAVRTPPEIYVTEARPIGFGLDMGRPRRNLLLATFEDRQPATRRIA